MSAGTRNPANSMNVGAKSGLIAIACCTVPGLVTPGQRTMKGILTEASYMNRLS
jgi:hypothetical protein